VIRRLGRGVARSVNSGTRRWLKWPAPTSELELPRTGP
jgi:hypothetical protein